MEPEIRYARTSDGVRIAYAVSGDSPTVLVLVGSGPIGWLQYEALPLRARWIGALARHFTFIRCDPRGSGLSQRDWLDEDRPSTPLDVDAVLSRLPVERFALFGLNNLTDPLIYASAHADRVSRIILWAPPIYDAGDKFNLVLGQLAGTDWARFVENYAHEAYGWEHGSEAHQYAAIMSKALTFETYRNWFKRVATLHEVAVEIAPRITVPVLMLAREAVACADHVTRVAEALPNATLRVVPGTSPQPFVEGTEYGTPVEGKVLGDGVMAVFTSAAQAIDAARRCVALSGGSELRLHIGLHAGDVIREENNVFGGAVNIAARICGVSAPGEILVSGTIRDLARTSAGVAFEDRGEHALKGIEDPVRVFAVRGHG